MIMFTGEEPTQEYLLLSGLQSFIQGSGSSSDWFYVTFTAEFSSKIKFIFWLDLISS